MRVAAVADVHFGPDARGSLRASLEGIERRADVLLIAGDLTRHGDPAEAEALAGELAPLRLPTVAVLGNHDYHQDAQERIASVVTRVGVRVLEGDATVVRVGGVTLGVAGVKGFGGGFAGAEVTAFGEPEVKAFVRASETAAAALREALFSLGTSYRVALLHYAPVPDTLRGERPEIYPLLGSCALARAIDEAGADLVLHGHAHFGAEKGSTPGGTPVVNVALPVIRAPYRILQLG